MVKHILLQYRLQGIQEEYAEQVAQRQEACGRSWPGGDLTMAQAVAVDVDCVFVGDGDKNGDEEQDQANLAAVWGVAPTSLWLARHGWEMETKQKTPYIRQS